MAAADRFAAPRNPVEQTVAGIWAELLGIERIGVEDNFFELGGHSLMATQLITRLRQIFQIDLPLAIIFKTPTVSAVAQFMRDHEATPGLTEKMALIVKRIAEMPAGTSSNYGPA
jgi:acyl carrier protein